MGAHVAKECSHSSFASPWVMGVQRMRNQLAAAERKAKKAATAAEAGPSGAPAGPAKKGGARKHTALAKPEVVGDNEAGPCGAAPQLPSSEAEQDGVANGAAFLADCTVWLWHKGYHFSQPLCR